jgi:hypothetical protein
MRPYWLTHSAATVCRSYSCMPMVVHELVEEARQIIAQRLLGLVQPA